MVTSASEQAAIDEILKARGEISEAKRIQAIYQRIKNSPGGSWGTRMLCFICKEWQEAGSQIYGPSFPYFACKDCYEALAVPDEPIEVPRSAVGKGSVCVARERSTGVPEWIKKLTRHELTEKEFSVHDVLAWIKSQNGPEFSYAGVRRVLKIRFMPTGRGTFKRVRR